METQEVKIEGNVIYLRGIREEDVNQNYYNWLNNPDVNAGLAKDYYSMEEIVEYVRNKSHSPHCYFFAIIDKESNNMIGTIKLDDYDEKAQHMELGIIIGSIDHRGKGYGKEACTLLINFGFYQLNLRKIWLAVHENNIVAIKLYAKLGFVIEGIQRKHVFKHGKYYDKYLMGIFNEEWTAKTKY